MLPKSLEPFIKKTQDHLNGSRFTKTNDIPLEFWKYDNIDAVEEGFYYLAGELMLSDIPQESIPVGYVHLTYLFSWEMQCSGEGWSAFDNTREDDIKYTINAYKFVGLNDEALGIEKAFDAWQTNPEDHDDIAEAYGSVENEYSDDFDRIPYIVEFFINNQEHFHEST